MAEDAAAGGRKKFSGRQGPNSYKSCKDRDHEDLLLFKDMHNREKDRLVSLLHPVSDEFEANGNHSLYGIMAGAPGKKGPAFDNILAESGKNDYDWLKTPPATPLFPSLEMETANNLPEILVQREIPILQPLTRFAGGKQPEEFRKQRVMPRYYSTAKGGRPSVSLDEKKSHRNAPAVNQTSCTEKMNLFLAANLSKSITGSSMDGSKNSDSNSNSNTKATKSKSRRGVSPSVRPRIPGLSEETISTTTTTATNLIKKTQERSVSASRGRTNTNFNTWDSKKKQDPINKTTRQSCSPSVTTRGRTQETQNFHQGNSNDSSSSRRTQVLGSRMVDRFLNARNMSNLEEKSYNKTKMIMNQSSNSIDEARRTSNEERHRQNKTKLNNTAIVNEGSGFGRLISKSSLDMALIKHMNLKELQRDSGISSKKGTTTSSRRSSSVSKRNPIP